MSREEVLEVIGRTRLIAIMRGDYRGAELEIVDAFAEGGIRAVEVTMNSPGAITSIESMVARFGDDVAIGAGTVLTPDQVDAVASVGASFIVSPNRNGSVIRRTRERGLASFPGCLTPTEIVEAVNAGADAVKLFPARLITPEIVRDLKGPLDDVRFIPTGAITPGNTRAFLDAGAWAFGVGSALIGKEVAGGEGLDRLRRRAAEFVASVRY